MLCVMSVWKVKNLQWQLLTTNKKRKLGDGLFTEEPDMEEAGPRDAEHYLDRLYTRMLAYALAGTSRVTGAPPAKDEEVMGADTTQFVSVPLDVLMKYFARAKRVTMQLPASKCLAWLQMKDTGERSEWVSKFRESTRSLGVVVKETYEARDAHWVITSTGDAQHGGQGSQPSQAGEVLTSHFQLGQKVSGKAVAKTMRDGTTLCAAFQNGNCKVKGASCPEGAHRCGVVTRGQRTCNSANHGAAGCTVKTRA